jgi:hypothetical protein
MKTQTEINQAKERMLAAEKLISKIVGESVDPSIFQTEEEAMEFEKVLDQYSSDIEIYDEIIEAMETEQKKKSVKSVSTTKVGSAVNALKQLIVTVKSFISTAITKIIAVKNFVSILIAKTTKAKNLIKAAVTELISLIKS